jgi:hypothetical protein
VPDFPPVAPGPQLLELSSQAAPEKMPTASAPLNDAIAINLPVLFNMTDGPFI